MHVLRYSTSTVLRYSTSTAHAQLPCTVFAAAADALARGAKSLEEKSPTDASALYQEAIEYYENDGKESQVNATSARCHMISYHAG